MPDVTARCFLTFACVTTAGRRGTPPEQNNQQLCSPPGLVIVFSFFFNWVGAGMYDEAVWLLGIAVKYGDPLHGSSGAFPAQQSWQIFLAWNRRALANGAGNLVG